jgi:hypothetical protein
MMDCKLPENLIGANGLLKQLFNKTRGRLIFTEVTKQGVHRGQEGEELSNAAFLNDWMFYYPGCL